MLTIISGVFFFIGGVLMLLGGFLEWAMGNTFPFVVFASFGKSITSPSNLHFKDRQSHFSLIVGRWWLAYGATIHSFFNAFGPYSPDHTNPADGLTTRSFNASFGFFMVFTSVLCFIYLVCSLLTNVVFVHLRLPFHRFHLAYWHILVGGRW